jgi:twinkle protein
MGLRQQSQHVVIKECPFCEKPTNNSADNQHKIYVKIGDGVYFCHRCGAKGSWNDFRRHIGGDQHQEDAEAWSEIGHIRMSPRHPPPARGYDRTMDTPSTSKSLPMPSERLNSCYITSLLDQPGSNASLEYLTNVRGFTTATLRKYGVGRGTYNFPGEDGRFVPAECITFPWILPAAEVVEQEELRGATIELPPNQAFVTRRIKARALENKAWQRLDPPGGGWGLFGYHTIPADATEIVVTEGEYDAMAGTFLLLQQMCHCSSFGSVTYGNAVLILYAVHQATGKPAVSLPNGCRSLPVEVLTMLQRYKKIYLWMDNDGPGQEGCEKFSEKLGIKRCYLVQPSCSPAPKDANEALQMGLDLTKLLDEADIMEHEYVVGFKGLRSQVMTQILNPDKYTGVPSQSLPGLTSIVKGFRRGELTVITGPTGSGKVC